MFESTNKIIDMIGNKLFLSSFTFMFLKYSLKIKIYMYIIFNYSSTFRDIFHVYIVYGHASDFLVFFSLLSLCILEHVASGFDYFWFFKQWFLFIYLFIVYLFTRLELSILIKPQCKCLCFYFIDFIFICKFSFVLCVFILF